MATIGTRDTPRMKMPPAWKVTFDLQARTAAGINQHQGLSGEARSDHLVLVGLTTPGGGVTVEDGVIGRLTTTSYQPYQADAVPDALRTARDACNVLSIAFGQVTVLEPVETPTTVERLGGAKDVPPGLRASLRMSGTLSIATGADYFVRDLAAAERVDEEPALRADLDTWRLAMLESDEPTRVIHFFRIYEREAQAIIDEEPQLLQAAELSECVRALSAILPSHLEKDERERVESTIRNALQRVRKRSRPAVLAEELTERLGRPVTTAQVSALDKARGRYAHRSTELGTDAEGADLLRDLARALLTEAAGITRG